MAWANAGCKPKTKSPTKPTRQSDSNGKSNDCSNLSCSHTGSALKGSPQQCNAVVHAPREAAQLECIGPAMSDAG